MREKGILISGHTWLHVSFLFIVILPRSQAPPAPPKNLRPGFQVFIHSSDAGLVSKEGLLSHRELMKQIAGFKTEIRGLNWTVTDFCVTTAIPKFYEEGIFTDLLNEVPEKFSPCFTFSPLDCFYDGHVMHPLDPPMEIPTVVSTILPSLRDSYLDWSNFDPFVFFSDVKTIFDVPRDLSNLSNGYQQKPCLEPMDEFCYPSKEAKCRVTKALVEAMIRTGRPRLKERSDMTSDQRQNLSQAMQTQYGQSQTQPKTAPATEGPEEDIGYDYLEYTDSSSSSSVREEHKRNAIICDAYVDSAMEMIESGFDPSLAQRLPPPTNISEAITSGCPINPFWRDSLEVQGGNWIFPKGLYYGKQQKRSLRSGIAFQGMQHAKTAIKKKLETNFMEPWDPTAMEEVYSVWIGRFRRFTESIHLPTSKLHSSFHNFEFYGRKPPTVFQVADSLEKSMDDIEDASERGDTCFARSFIDVIVSLLRRFAAKFL